MTPPMSQPQHNLMRVSTIAGERFGAWLIPQEQSANFKALILLRKRSPWLMGAALLTAIGALYISASSVILNGFAQVERKTALQRVSAVQALIQAELQQLGVSAEHYGTWNADDLLENESQPHYFGWQDSDDYLRSLRLNFFSIRDSSDQTVLNQQVDLTQDELAKIDDNLEHYLLPTTGLQNSLSRVSRTGLIGFNDQILLLATTSVLLSNGKETEQCTIILGRLLSREQFRSLDAITQAKVEIFSISDVRASDELRSALITLQTGQQSIVQFAGINQVVAYTLLRDVEGRSTALLKVSAPRATVQQAFVSLGYLTLALVLVGGGLSLVVGILSQRLLQYLQERDRIQTHLAFEQEFAQITLHAITEGVIMVDPSGTVLSLNRAAEQLLGWSSEQARGQGIEAICQLMYEDTLEPFDLLEQVLKQRDAICDIELQQLMIARSNDSIAVDCSISLIQLTNQNVVGAVIMLRDVTSTRRLTQQLSWQANYDVLTGLLNRRGFESRLEDAIATINAANHKHTLFFIDLDRFKVVNDTCGHLAGDELLRQISQQIQMIIRKSDVVARLGGDEFAVLLYQCDQARAAILAEEICRTVREFRFVWQGNLFTIGASVGLLPLNGSMATTRDILSAADQACYLAKQTGRGQVYICSAFQSQSPAYPQGQVVQQLSNALERDRLRLYFQEIEPLQARSQHKTGYEVLLRLSNDTGELIQPGGFLPLAERYSLMPSVDRWVVQHLLRQLHEQFKAQLTQSTYWTKELFFAVNLSIPTIKDEQFVDFLWQQFANYPIPADMICFEISESAAINHFMHTSELIQQIRQIGCQVALDDFGSSMASFTHLKHLSVDYLKIDGNLINEIIDNPTNLAIVESIHKIGQSIGFKTIAKFASTEALKAKLIELNIDYAQGYAIAPPCPWMEITPNLR